MIFVCTSILYLLNTFTAIYVVQYIYIVRIKVNWTDFITTICFFFCLKKYISFPTDPFAKMQHRRSLIILFFYCFLTYLNLVLYWITHRFCSLSVVTFWQGLYVGFLFRFYIFTTVSLMCCIFYLSRFLDSSRRCDFDLNKKIRKK